MTNKEIDFLILGAGVTGLAAGLELKESSIIIEKECRPGGLVRTHCFDNGYWFDHVLHLLHFKDTEIQERIQVLMGDMLQRCSPAAWIECSAGTVLYPFQLNLGALNEKARNKCISDYAKMFFSAVDKSSADNYRQYLALTFGNAMCDLFYFPYNEKLYKYPLEQIAADALLWNLHRPSFEEILDGSFNPNRLKETYNTNAFYPCPPVDSPVRGMEALVQSLSSNLNNIQLNSEVVHIDTRLQLVHILKNGIPDKIHYNYGCLSTIPLPRLMRLCSDVPEQLLKRADQLIFTKVYSIAISVKGKRPEGTGHWRYYTNPDIPFTRLIFMTAFDTNNAPQDGWGLLAEVTCNEKETIDTGRLVQQTINAVKTLGYFDETQQIVGTHIWPVEFAYVIFTPETKCIVEDCFEFLEQYGIAAAGRYGKWQYSSIYQNIKEGFTWAKEVSEKVSV